MPRNTAGGSGHKAQSNSESSKARNNRCLVDDLLDDYRNEEKTEGVYVGRINRRLGSGRMEVFYIETKTDDVEGEIRVPTTRIIPMRGGLRGKGKKSVWVDIGSIVMVVDTGLAQTTHEIAAVFSAEQVGKYRKYCPNADERLFIKDSNGNPDDESGFIIESYDEVNIDTI